MMTKISDTFLLAVLTAFVGANTVTFVAPSVTADSNGVIDMTDTSVVRLYAVAASAMVA